ncbi:MAG: anaerobic glycerol-3-phosphate dehydrogenase subunit C [Gemmatimonadetes bacterium]|nr:anaerobic glycerol-3-phosphate dehydrogenase subunit C [Gemmatimonadota bacterium]
MDTAWQEQIGKEIDCAFRFDETARVLYSTDASIYEIEPLGVAYPANTDQVSRILRFAYERGISVTPRGGGTSLGGQAVGRSIQVDFSRHMNRILEVNVEERWARIQPGVVLDELNAHLKPLGLLFAPDVSPSNRANVGGMIGNNSCGSHSIIYGKTIDHVLELDVVLSDGTRTVFKPVGDREYGEKAALGGLEGRIYREIRRIAHENRDEIEARYPRIMRRVGGYNLDEFIGEGPFDPCKMIVGSEGTLAAVTEARVNLVPLPAHKALSICHFSDLIESMEATVEILKTDPSAVELTDKTILDLAKASPAAAHQRDFIEGDPEAILMVEYYGETAEAVAERMDALESLLREKNLGYACVRAATPAAQANAWGIRKAGLGLLMGMKGDTKPATFVEDTAVSPEKLPDYIRDFRDIVHRHGTVASYYAHASVGTIHIRPLINLKEAEGIARMRAIAEEIRDLVIAYGGAVSSEHGDGLVRSEWNEQVFGPKLYEAFKTVKAVFDPNGIMNPGKIIANQKMTDNLRFGPAYQAEEINTYFDFSGDGGFSRSIELCNGVGACRKKLVGTMCPSYIATLDEEHSTRGRANVLRAALSGKLDGEGFTSRRVYEALDLCLECKGCKGECPSNVDMAKMKYEFLAHYYEKHGLPLRNRIFGRIETLNRLGSAFAPLSNRIVNHPWHKSLLERAIGVDRRRSLPEFAEETFEQWFYQRAPGRAADRDRPTVVFFPDTFINYSEPHIGIAAVEVLERAGYRVVLAEPRACCGRPLISKGMLRQARAAAEYNIAQMERYVDRGWTIVGCEPSCVMTFRDDYRDLVDDPRAAGLADGMLMIDEFLAREHAAGRLSLPVRPTDRAISLHGHCQQKAIAGTGSTVAALELVPGYEVTTLNTGCCGMAGSFGYEREHYDLSMKIGEDRLFPAIRAAGERTEFAATGTSCRHQIADGTGRSALHPIELIRAAVDDRRSIQR